MFNDRDVLKTKGPLLLACNHPNSFLDAIIIGSYFKRPVHFLARGDAFRKPLVKKILTTLKLIPIYRLSEGREYLALNDATFEQCGEILADGGIVLIFAEGLSKNEWLLRALKKGAARIAFTAFTNQAIRESFKVIPVGLNYNGFDNIGKRVIIHFEKAITAKYFSVSNSPGDFIQQFNQLLYASLQKAVLMAANTGNSTIRFLISNDSAITVNKENTIASLKSLQTKINNSALANELAGLKPPMLLATSTLHFILNLFTCIILFIAALAGWLLNAPLFYPLKKWVRKKTTGTVFYDSVMFGALLLLYPVYWLFLNLIIAVFVPGMMIQTIVFLSPVFGLIYLIWRDCAGRNSNYLLLSRLHRSILAKILYS
jgi:1-acyl-sn-glycerol-3-phosphate acyltransferase